MSEQDTREAIAQAIYNSDHRSYAGRPSWSELIHKDEYLRNADAVLPFIEQAEQRGYERGREAGDSREYAAHVAGKLEGKREALEQARAKIKSYQQPTGAFTKSHALAMLDALQAGDSNET